MRIGPNPDFDGLEFLKDGKLLANEVGGPSATGLNVGGALTGTYSILEGSRVSLGMGPQSLAATVYEATISGDELQLKEAALPRIHAAARPRRLTWRS